MGSQREAESFFLKCITNDSLMEKIKQVLDKNDTLDSISTRYGSSMRGSSLDARSAG
jgi:hypothetical protein